MNEPHWERKMREKFHFLYPSEKVSRVVGKYTFVAIITFSSLIGLYAVGTITWKDVFHEDVAQEQSENISSVVDSQTGEIDNEKLKEYLLTGGIGFMLSKEPNLFTYEEFIEKLEQTCPYYEPSGTAYRECLYNLLEKKNKQVVSFSDDLIKDIQVVISEKKTNPDEIDLSTAYFGEEYFLASFAELQKSWKSYRDALCEADYATSFPGSNTGGFIMTCKLYETEKYLVRLASYTYDWVASAAIPYLEENKEPRTTGFRALIEKERKLLGR